MKKNRIYRKKHLNILLSAGIIGTLGIGSIFFSTKHKTQTVNKAKTEQISKIKKNGITNPLCEVEYNVDTLLKASPSLLYYNKGKVTRNYVEKNNLYKMSLGLFAHEWWHAHNAKLKYRTLYAYTPQQYRNLCMHDEISACINTLLTFRYEYIGAEDKKSVIKKYERGGCEFYFKAIREGKINPLTDSPQSKEKEWQFIANGVKNYWLEKAAPHYAERQYKMMERYCSTYNSSFLNDSIRNEKYKEMCHKMYTIGGVDFFKYMKEDIRYNDDRVLVINQLHRIKSLQDDEKFLTTFITRNLPSIYKLSPSKKKKALQHLLISGRLAAKLKGIHNKKLEENPHIVDQLYQTLFKDFSLDNSFENFIKIYPALSSSNYTVTQKDDNYEEIVKNFYKRNGLNLTKYIDNFYADEVPYSSIFEKEEKRYDSNIALFNNIFLDLAREDSKMFFITENHKSNIERTQENYQHHISEVQKILIPDFSQPILTQATTEQQEQICSYINYFNSIPDVFKLCDTKDQQKFLQKNPDYKINFLGIKHQEMSK